MEKGEKRLAITDDLQVVPYTEIKPPEEEGVVVVDRPEQPTVNHRRAGAGPVDHVRSLKVVERSFGDETATRAR